jgi:ABC-type lipoprotein export system ATPase subunit
MEGIDITFPRRDQPSLVIVAGFHLVLTAGVMHCVAGRSGSGKTSLLRVAVALSAPTRGAVRWHGQRVDELNAAELARARREHMSYVDQDATVIEQLSAIDNVLLPAVPAGIDKATEARAADLLDLFGLSQHARHLAGALSGGERQRLALARALLLRPRLVAVDEPTASLDRASADAVIEALRVVSREGAAVLAASHDPELVAASDAVSRLN